MNEWKDVSIGDLCETVSNTYRRKDKEVILVNTSDVLEGKILNHQPVPNENLKGQFKKTFQQDDILYSEIRPANKRYAFVDFESTDHYIASTKLMVLRPKTEIVTPRYLYAVLTSKEIIDEMQHLAETRSGTFPQITFSSELAPYHIKLPNLEIQKKIVSLLDAIEHKIETNAAINENLLQQLDALYQELSTRDTWDITPIGELAEKIAMGPFGSNIKVSTFVPYGVPIISGNHLRGYFLEEPSYNYITEEHAERLKNSVVYPGDVVFTHAGNIGQVTMIPDGCDYHKYVLSQRQFYLRCNTEKLIPEYVTLFFHSKEGQHELLSYANQTGVPSIAQPASNLKKISLPVPPLQIQEEWAALVRPIISQYQQNKLEIRTLSTTRDTLLPKLMSGKIDVSNIQL